MLGFLEGRAELFTPLYRRLAPTLYAYALRRTQQHERAEDVVQSTFVKLYRARHQYRPGTLLLPWVMTIAKNTLYDDFRLNSRRPDLPTFDGELPLSIANDLHAYLEADDSIEHALGQLSPEQRRAVELTRLQGLAGEEAAEQLGVSQGAVKLRVHRAITSLRRAIVDAWETSSASLAPTGSAQVSLSPA